MGCYDGNLTGVRLSSRREKSLGMELSPGQRRKTAQRLWLRRESLGLIFAMRQVGLSGYFLTVVQHDESVFGSLHEQESTKDIVREFLLLRSNNYRTSNF